MTKPIKLFVSYAREDESAFREMRVRLGPFIRSGLLSLWSDHAIPAGSAWEDEIESALSECVGGILLVTPAFLDSEFIHERELPPLLKKRVFWVPIRPSGYKQTALNTIHALRNPKQPLSKLEDRDEAWVEICKALVEALNGLASEGAAEVERLQGLLASVYRIDPGQGLLAAVTRAEHRMPPDLVAEIKDIAREDLLRRERRVDVDAFKQRCNDALYDLGSIESLYKEDPPGFTLTHGVSWQRLDAHLGGSHNVGLYGENQGLNQKWVLRQVDRGLVALADRQSMRVLDAWQEGGRWRVHTQPYHGADNQRWRLHPQKAEIGSYLIESEASGYVLGGVRVGPEGSHSHSAKETWDLTLAPRDANALQSWYIHPSLL